MAWDEGRDAVRAQIASTDRVPRRGVADELDHDDFRAGPDRSDSHSGQSDDRSIAQGGDRFQGHVAGALDGPFVVLLQEDGADEPDDRVVVGEDADDLGPPFDLAVEPFEAVG